MKIRTLPLLAALLVAQASAPALAFFNPAVTPLAAFVGAANHAKPARSLTGYAGRVLDGDTFYMQIDGQPTRVRLAQIDTPERGQPFGRRAGQSLQNMIEGVPVTISWRTLDNRGRPIAQVVANGIDVNAEQVRRGFAWVYRQYATDRSLDALEAEARKAGRGLWADANPVPPWEWRKAHPKDERQGRD